MSISIQGSVLHSPKEASVKRVASDGGRILASITLSENGRGVSLVEALSTANLRRFAVFQGQGRKVVTQGCWHDTGANEIWLLTV